MKRIFLIAITIFIISSCKDSDSPKEIPATGTHASPHYITEYLVASEIAVENRNGTLCLKVSGDEYYTCDRSNISKEALELVNLYNDKSYTGHVYPGMSPALAYPIGKITVCCDMDFDAEHPAGEPLDDIAQLGFCSFYPYIANGYNPFPFTEDWQYSDRVRYTMPFASVNAEVTKLMWAYFLTYKISPSYVAKIEFATQPEEAGEYTFTLRMTTHDKTFETNFTHTFK